MTRMYLGDSVYVDRWHDGIVLTTDNGSGVTNTIYLGAEVLAALLAWLAAVPRPAPGGRSQWEESGD